MRPWVLPRLGSPGDEDGDRMDENSIQLVRLRKAKSQADLRSGFVAGRTDRPSGVDLLDDSSVRTLVELQWREERTVNILRADGEQEKVRVAIPRTAHMLVNWSEGAAIAAGLQRRFTLALSSLWPDIKERPTVIVPQIDLNKFARTDELPSIVRRVYEVAVVDGVPIEGIPSARVICKSVSPEDIARLVAGNGASVSEVEVEVVDSPLLRVRLTRRGGLRVWSEGRDTPDVLSDVEEFVSMFGLLGSEAKDVGR